MNLPRTLSEAAAGRAAQQLTSTKRRVHQKNRCNFAIAAKFVANIKSVGLLSDERDHFILLRVERRYHTLSQV